MPPEATNLGPLRRAVSWAPILCYHDVLPDDTDPLPPYAITQSGLRAVLADFTRRGYTSGTLDEVLHGAPRGKKRLVLTFDDGTSDFPEFAVPVLREFNFSATLFIVAGLMGKGRSWARRPDLDEVPLMAADEIKHLHAEGFSIGSHTMTHPVLPNISADAARRELTESRAILTDLLGEPTRWFAYPYLEANQTTRALVREAGYEAAAGGYNQPHELYYLNRIDGTMYPLPELRLRSNGIHHLVREMRRRVKRKT